MHGYVLIALLVVASPIIIPLLRKALTAWHRNAEELKLAWHIRKKLDHWVELGDSEYAVGLCVTPEAYNLWARAVDVINGHSGALSNHIESNGGMDRVRNILAHN